MDCDFSDKLLDHFLSYWCNWSRKCSRVIIW